MHLGAGRILLVNERSAAKQKLKNRLAAFD
jgi:hypothetical protein